MRVNKAACLALTYPLLCQALPGYDRIKAFPDKKIHNDGIYKQINRNRSHRQLEDSPLVKCDLAFMQCITDMDCSNCYESLETANIDWASVDPLTPCTDVVDLLAKSGYCTAVQKGKNSQESFCQTFDACVWIDDDYYFDDYFDEDQAPNIIDCSTLTSCNWEGMHSTFVGDGICHDYSCYNTEICNFDGGDCCEDTCLLDVPFQYSECGEDGYYCRDSKSAACDPFYSADCEEGEEEKGKEKPVECGKDETIFVLDMYDSWGDGWDNTDITIAMDGKDPAFTGKLEKGAHGSETICLEKGCYNAKTGGGVWGNEIAWEIHAGKPGFGPPIAYGGAPMDCSFSVGTNACDNTCTGRVADPYDDARLTYEKLLTCISDVCVIQMGMCEMDRDCAPCLTDMPPEYCRTNVNYNNLVDCSLCNCVPGEDDDDYCSEKQTSSSNNGKKDTDGSIFVPKDPEKKQSNSGECNPDQTLKGSSAVMKYSKCTDIDQTVALLTTWDENNFGPLDEFELCSHTFKQEYAHGGKKALDCMRILATIADQPESAEREDIWSLANSLYHDAENFCECTAASNKICPSCNSFTHFKTLLHESLDACVALDEIDCDAWAEFYSPCKDNLYEKFGKLDFNNKAQCEYVSSDCGGAGSFPAFRRLDCGSEIQKPAWDFYISYERGCLKDVNPRPPPPPAPSPPVSPSSPVSPSKPYKPPYVPTSGNEPFSPSEPEPAPAPYTPTSSTSSKEYYPKKKHRFRNFMIFVFLCAGGVFLYKKRNEDFDFQRYRRLQRFHQPPAREQELYSGLTGGMQAPSFEPPTLPPEPPASDFEPRGV